MTVSVRQMIVVAVGSFAAIFWSSDEYIRLAIRTLNTSYSIANDVIHPAFVSGIVFIYLTVTYLYIKSLDEKYRFFYIACSLLVALSIYRLEGATSEKLTDGATQLTATLFANSAIHSLIVLHQDYPHEQYLPQLNYYAKGWLLGWDSSRSGQTITWERGDSLLRINAFPKIDAVVVYVPWDDFKKRSLEESSLLRRINDGMHKLYNHSIHEKKYDLYW